jgi:hypothetical protein
MVKESSNEAAISSKIDKKDENLSKIGKLENPGTAEIKYDEEFQDDYVSEYKSEFSDIKHKADPEFADISRQETKIKRWALGSDKIAKNGKDFISVIGNETKSGIERLYTDMSKKCD